MTLHLLLYVLAVIAAVSGCGRSLLLLPVVLAAFRIRKRRGGLPALVAAALALTAGWRSGCRRMPDKAENASVAIPARVTGTVLDAPAPVDWGCAFPLRIETTDGSDRRLRALVTATVHVPGRVPDLRPGHRVAVAGPARVDPALRRPPLIAAPDASAISVLGRADPEPGILLAGIRDEIRRRFRAALPPRAALLLASLVLGDHRLTPDLDRAFRRAGVMHFLAVSGLHMTLLLVISTRLFRLLPVPRPCAAVIQGGFLLLYAVLTGFGGATARGLVMALVWLAARSASRPQSPGRSLLLAAAILLALDPENLVSAGCQLSFAAMGAILFVAGPVDARARRKAAEAPERHAVALARLTGRALRASLWAHLATFPVAFLRLHGASWISIPATVLLAPLFPALMILGFILAVLPAEPSWLVACAAAPLSILAEATLRIVETLSSLPAGWVEGPPPPAAALLLYAGLFLLLAAAAPRGPRAAAAATAPLIVLALLLPLLRPLAAERGLLVIDVGQGAAAAFRAGGATVLVDAGATGVPDRTARTIAEALRDRGVRSIDLLVLTHADSDHVGAVEALAETMRIRRAVTGPGFEEHGRGARVLAAVSARGAAIDRIHAGVRLRIGELCLTAIHPPGGPAAGTAENEDSLVLRVTMPGLACLVTGDIGDRALRRLLPALRGEPASPGRAAPTRILMMPHHGAWNGLTEHLLGTVCPDVAVISARRSFVPPRTRLALAESGIRTVATWQDGTVFLPAAEGREPRNP